MDLYTFKLFVIKKGMTWKEINQTSFRLGNYLPMADQIWVSRGWSSSELFYASAKENEYMAPLVENPIPIPVVPPCPQDQSPRDRFPLEEIVEEPREAVCDELNALLREAEVERVRDLQEESYCSVVHPSPWVGSERWKNYWKFDYFVL